MTFESRVPNTPNERLRAARIAAGFPTARDAAKHFGWVDSTYRGHEAGPREISKKAALNYAAAFKIGVAWLLTGRDDNHEVSAPEQVQASDIPIATNSLRFDGRLPKSQAERLRAARIAVGFKTQRDACLRYGWNENTYRSHENGPRQISKWAAFRYAAAFNVGVSWLLTGVDDPREAPASERIETFAEEVTRLKAEIAERQQRLADLVFGNGHLDNLSAQMSGGVNGVSHAMFSRIKPSSA